MVGFELLRISVTCQVKSVYNNNNNMQERKKREKSIITYTRTPLRF